MIKRESSESENLISNLESRVKDLKAEFRLDRIMFMHINSEVDEAL